jgi:hypothetical protein
MCSDITQPPHGNTVQDSKNSMHWSKTKEFHLKQNVSTLSPKMQRRVRKVDASRSAKLKKRRPRTACNPTGAVPSVSARSALLVRVTWPTSPSPAAPTATRAVPAPPRPGAALLCRAATARTRNNAPIGRALSQAVVTACARHPSGPARYDRAGPNGPQGPELHKLPRWD